MRLEALRNALNYVTYPGRDVGEYRLRGRTGAWKLLTLNPALINLGKYDYRTSTKRLWIEGSTIACSAGSLPKKVAQRILNIAAKRGARSFYLGGYTMYPKTNGDLTVGCQEFTKKDVKYAQQLLKA